MPNELAAYAMWNDATSDLDAEQHRREYVAAKVAVANLWPFLAVASSEDEFGNRLSLVAAQIEAATPPALRAEVVAGLHQDYTAMCAQQAAQERQQALSVTASANQPVPESYVHVQTRDGYWQVDRIEREQVTTLGRTASLDVAYEAAREQGMPVYADGAFLGLPPVQASQEFYDAESGRWVHLANKQGAFTPDPTDAWRYSHYPPTPPQPGFGGSPAGPDDIPAQSSIGPDGFPLDLGVGEQRTPEAYARQTTPGAWAVPPGGGWRDDARNNAATGLPQGQHISSRHGRAVRAHTPGVPHTAADDPDEWSDSNWLHDHGTSDFYGGDTGQADYVKCPDCGEQRARPGRSCPGCGSQATAKISVRHTAEEGVRPPSGNPYAPNPNYFSMGTDKTGPPTFPEDPAAEPKVDNNIDDFYGAVPPQQSSGSSEGLVDGGGYSRMGAKTICNQCHGAGTINDGAKSSSCPTCGGAGRTSPHPKESSSSRLGTLVFEGEYQYVHKQGDSWVITQKGTGKVLSHHDSEEDAKSAFRAMMRNKTSAVSGPPPFPVDAIRHTAPGGGVHSPYRIKKVDGGYAVVNDQGERKNEEAKTYAEARQLQQALYKNVPGASEKAEKAAAYQGVRRTGLSHAEREALIAEAEGEPTHGWRPGEEAELPEEGYDAYARDTRHNLGRMASYPLSGPPVPPGAGYRNQDRQPPADEDSECTCRYDSQGVCHLDPQCVEHGHYAEQAKQGARFADPTELHPGTPTGYLRSQHGQTDGRIVGHCDHCSNPVRWHSGGEGEGEDSGHLEHLHNGSHKCGEGSTTARTGGLVALPQFFDSAATFARAASTDLAMSPAAGAPGATGSGAGVDGGGMGGGLGAGGGVGGVGAGAPAGAATPAGPAGAPGAPGGAAPPAPAQPAQAAQPVQAPTPGSNRAQAQRGRVSPTDSHLHPYSPIPSSGMSTQDVARMSAQALQTLTAPTPENPSGKDPDEYRSNTWEGLINQRPMQSAEDRHMNTPVGNAPDPRKTRQINTPTPGLGEDDQEGQDRDDEDQDEERE